MRLALSRLTAVIVIGVAIAAMPGVAVTRVGREGAARMATRSGLHRLSASEAVVLGFDDTAPDVAPAGDLISGASVLRDAGSPPGLPPATTAAVPPSAGSILLAVAPPLTLRSADSFLRPLGRAPPAR